MIWAYSWAVPNEKAIGALAELSPLVELGAGTGYWAWLCRQAGADILAFDRNASAPPHWHPVEEGGPEKLRGLSERTLLLCWPPLDEPLALEGLRAYAGLRVALIGEYRGRTGSAQFHDELEESFEPVSQLELPRWPGFRDDLRIFRRRFS